MELENPSIDAGESLADVARRLSVTYGAVRNAANKARVAPARIVGNVKLYAAGDVDAIVRALAESTPRRHGTNIPEVNAL